jgi:uncharacterized protein (DUF983 family)
MNSSSNSGIGFFPILGLIFIVLKLTGFIDWSWYLVTLPIWGGLVLSIIILLIVYLIFLRKRKM